MTRRLLFLILALAVVSPLSLSAQSAKPPQVIVIEGRRDAGEAAVSTKSIVYLRFDVPEGVTGIQVKKEIKVNAEPGERLSRDHALFDPRGYEFPGKGFRGSKAGGWPDFMITGDPATTSRWLAPGPIYPGTWHLMQWLRMCPKSGLSYKYTITLSFDGPAPPTDMPAVPPYDPGIINPKRDWYPGNLHAHTYHSDGSKSLAEVVERAEAQGFSFLALTDHNSVLTHHEFAEVGRAHPKFLLLCGEEFTSPYGHANIIGMRAGEWFDFRVDSGDGRLPRIIDMAHESGAVFSVNHPYSTCLTCLWRFLGSEWTKADAVEVWSGPFGDHDRRAVDLWESMLRFGKHINAFGGSDYHTGDGAWTPAVWVYAENLSQPAVMDALRKGRIFLSDGLNGPKVFLSVRGRSALPGDTIEPDEDGTVPVEVRVIGGKGMTLRLIWLGSEINLPVETDYAVLSHAVPVNTTHSYVRAELLRPDGGMAALTNPIYVGRPN